MKSPQSLDTNLIYLCGRVTQLVHEKITEDFRKNGINITVEQFGILSALWYEEGMNQQKLADTLHKDKSTIVRNLNRMVKAGLIKRKTDKQDRRNQQIFLTGEGKKLQNNTVTLTGATYIRALQSMDQTSLDLLVENLNQVIKNLK